MSSNNIFVIFFTYIEISKDSSTKYYQNNKERLQKRTRERYQTLCKEKKRKKTDNMVVKDTKIYQEMKNKVLVEYRKKPPYYNYKKLVLKSNGSESSFDVLKNQV